MSRSEQRFVTANHPGEWLRADRCSCCACGAHFYWLHINSQQKMQSECVCFFRFECSNEKKMPLTNFTFFCLFALLIKHELNACNDWWHVAVNIGVFKWSPAALLFISADRLPGGGQKIHNTLSRSQLTSSHGLKTQINKCVLSSLF